MPTITPRPSFTHQITSPRLLILSDQMSLVNELQNYLTDAGVECLCESTNEPGSEPDLLVVDKVQASELELDSLPHCLPILLLTDELDDSTNDLLDVHPFLDLLEKPVDSRQFIQYVRRALLRREAYLDHIDGKVMKRTAEISRSRLEIIQVLACAAEYRDRQTGNHVLRVGRYAGIIAKGLGFSPMRVEMIEHAAILHDVGKLGVSDSILLKPDKLTEEERATMMRHCQYGMNMLRGRYENMTQAGSSSDRACESSILKLAAIISMTHHERWDGTGYPNRLAGDRIPIEGRITAVADVFDALSTRRPYKEPTPLSECFAILEKGRGKQFDPSVLDAFFASTEEITKFCNILGDPLPTSLPR
jgi:putative two-component system response regulator